jgi:E3 ubiquitin-protein ligase HOS1
LEHLASIDLIELCSEAKVERCRATRDLRSCGRYVQYVLNSCSHASLCSECSQRCDICPICRIPIPKTGIRLRPRLYYECIESGLVSKRCDERFQEKEDADNELTTDVQRLYSLFDVALENNLVSLICHCIPSLHPCLIALKIGALESFLIFLNEIYS